MEEKTATIATNQLCNDTGPEIGGSSNNNKRHVKLTSFVDLPTLPDSYSSIRKEEGAFLCASPLAQLSLSRVDSLNREWEGESGRKALLYYYVVLFHLRLSLSLSLYTGLVFGRSF